MSNVHLPVLLAEVLEYLNPQSGDNFVDGTLGGGGYTLELVKKVAPTGKILTIDLDAGAIERFKETSEFEKFKNNLVIVEDNFSNLEQICYERNFNQPRGVVVDLGLSSNQLTDSSRGFSFQDQGFLDMRFGRGSGSLTAFEIINQYRAEEISNIFFRYGEERLARKIAEAIVERRQEKPIADPTELAELVAGVYRRYFKTKSKIHPATKVFQALRIAVNGELDNLNKFLVAATRLLPSGGRLAVVSFHSLEDRLVKNWFRAESRDCQCPPELPVCQCGHLKSLKIITKKPIEATSEEIKNNPRARSAKLRVAEKI